MRKYSNIVKPRSEYILNLNDFPNINVDKTFEKNTGSFKNNFDQNNKKLWIDILKNNINKPFQKSNNQDDIIKSNNKDNIIKLNNQEDNIKLNNQEDNSLIENKSEDIIKSKIINYEDEDGYKIILHKNKNYIKKKKKDSEQFVYINKKVNN